MAPPDVNYRFFGNFLPALNNPGKISYFCVYAKAYGHHHSSVGFHSGVESHRKDRGHRRRSARTNPDFRNPVHELYSQMHGLGLRHAECQPVAIIFCQKHTKRPVKIQRPGLEFILLYAEYQTLPSRMA